MLFDKGEHETMDARILAGENEASIPVKGINKAFLTFDGKPLVGMVIEALDRAETISSTIVVGPKAKLEAEIENVSTHKQLRVLEQGDNIFDNIWRGSLSTFPDYRPGMGSKELDHSSADKAVLVVTSDVPLL